MNPGVERYKKYSVLYFGASLFQCIAISILRYFDADVGKASSSAARRA
jgi:hypothetical protein